MKKFWAFLLCAALLGTTVAWSINYQRFGKRDAYLGPFTTSEDVVVDDVLASIMGTQEEVDARVEVLDDLKYDFGIMTPGSTGEHSFRIKNVGTDDLRLRLGATTCKCTLGELDREALAPGEETEITLTWTVKEGEPNFKQTAQVITNDPARVVLQFEISGKIIRDIEIVPETWTFGEVATGEPIELEGTIYNYMDKDIKPTDVSFSSQEMTDLATFEVEPFDPAEGDDEIRAKARQAFRVKANIAAGMRQGAVSQNFVFGFRMLDENGQELPKEGENLEDPNYYVMATTQGRVVGSLGMLPNSRIKGEDGGGYIFDIGKIGKDDPLVVNTFVVLKGEHRENTTLSVGEVVPDQVLRASLGEPKGRGSMTLYPLTLEFIPSEETVERVGANSADYGQVMIESDNPKVTKMRIALKFSLEGR